MESCSNQLNHLYSSYLALPFLLFLVQFLYLYQDLLQTMAIDSKSLSALCDQTFTPYTRILSTIASRFYSIHKWLLKFPVFSKKEFDTVNLILNCYNLQAKYLFTDILKPVPLLFSEWPESNFQKENVLYVFFFENCKFTMLSPLATEILSPQFKFKCFRKGYTLFGCLLYKMC